MLKPVPVEPVLSVKELYTLYYFHHESGYRFAGESHDFWEIIYVDKGRASGINGTEPYTLEKGQIIFHHPNVFHNFRTDGAPDAECCFSKRMRKVFRKNEKSMLQNCNKKAKKKRAFTTG